MGKYQAEQSGNFESSRGNSFRLEKDGDKVRVVFLYSDPHSIDGWACHRFQKPNGYTHVVDCPRGPKDPLDMCPACKDKNQLYTRIFVRMLNLTTNEVTIWDRASSFRKDLTGFMEYFNPLYSKVYEITRRGSGLQTQYTYQSLNDSGIDEAKYLELVAKSDEVASDYVRPIDSYQTVLADWQAAKDKETQEGVNVSQPAPGAWGQPAPGAWGQPPAQQYPQQGQPAPGTWGQPPAQPAPQQPMQTPPPQQYPPQGQPTPPQGQPGQQPAPQSWGQPPQAWGQPPQGNQ